MSLSPTTGFGHALSVDTDERIPRGPEQHRSSHLPPHDQYDAAGTHVERQRWNKVVPVLVKLALGQGGNKKRSMNDLRPVTR